MKNSIKLKISQTKKESNLIKVILLLHFIITLSVIGYSQGAAINTSGAAADPSAIFDANSNNQGLLLPRLSTVERNAIMSPANSLLIFNTTTNCFETFVNNVWQTIWCSCSNPSSPIQGINNPDMNEIEWNWNTVSGADGYKYNTINDYNTATDNGTSTTYTQTGLTCNTSYSLYIWAYNTCGGSSSTTLTESTTACVFICGTSNVTFTYKGNNATYGSVLHNGKCWLDRNLGATQVATAYNDIDSYGDLFQWGRLDDGHQNRNSSLTSNLSGSDNPGHSNLITTSTYPNDWRSPQNNNLWQGISGINNPCPTDWRIPTESELETERLSWSSNNRNGAYASLLKITTGGYRNFSGGLDDVSSMGYYWSSTISGTYSRYLAIQSGDAYWDQNGRGYGFSVRCIKE